VLIGPEGDFSIDEVKLAMQHGYKSISLGKSRLRTETAGLMAVAMCQLAQK
ncbi:MAG TPA: RsmE family RNA methyltransferase, partial [Xylanibacter oryzae]|nr:RsmE family RNA methyltransferase [Xylanibacter oryzae]